MSAAKGSPTPRTEMDALLLGRLDELADSEPNTRGRSLLGIILSIVVLLCISLLIVATIVIMNPEIANLGAHRRQTLEAISLEEALLGSLAARDFSSQWLPASCIQGRQLNSLSLDQMVYEDSRNIYLISLPNTMATNTINVSNQKLSATNETGEQIEVATPFEPDLSVLVSNTSLLSSIDYQGFKLSPSKRYLLLWTSRRKQFRHSFTAKYFLYDIQLDLISMLSTSRDDQRSTSSFPSPGANLNPKHNHYESLDSASLYLNDEIGSRANGNQSPNASSQDERDLELSVRFQLVDWFSSGSESDSLLLVQNNDIFVLNHIGSDSEGVRNDEQTNRENASSGQPVRLTRTGQIGVIFNGVPDWLYEEEILGSSLALRVAPDGHRLAYLSFNDSLVAQVPLMSYGNERSAPEVRHIRYPKAGGTNPIVSVHIVENLSSIVDRPNEPLRLELPAHLEVQEHYINRLQWLTNDKLGLIWSSRSQNESQVLVCSKATSWRCETSFAWQAQDGWLDIGDHLHPLDSQHYLLLVPKFESIEAGNFTHLAKVSLSKPGELIYITSGQFEVVSVNGVDLERQLVYFTSTLENRPGERYLQVASLVVGPTQSQANQLGTSHCVTCDHYPKRCLFNEVKLSPSNGHYVFHCDGPDVPLVELRQLLEQPNRKTSSRLLWIIEDNRLLRDKLALTKAMPVQVRLKVPIEGTRYSANVMLLLPPLLGSMARFRVTSTSFSRGTQLADGSGSTGRQRRLAWNSADGVGKLEWDKQLDRLTNGSSSYELGLQTLRDYLAYLSPASQHQYPMIVEVYGGPNSQRIDQRFGVHLGHYFASNQRAVYAMIDGRGSGFEGSRRSFELYHRLGTVEIEDQLQVAHRLAHGLLAPLVDSSKMAIWGWSYGGYVAAMALAQGTFQSNRPLPAPDLWADSRGQKDQPLGPLREVFECAASVAPVTDWTLYDTAYTEKYMASPWKSDQIGAIDSQLNENTGQARENIWTRQQPTLRIDSNKSSDWDARHQNNRQLSSQHLNERYRKASLLERIGAIDRKRFLLIHGTADDNVHYQQSIMLMKELIRRNILFETRLYPDQDHSISSRAEKLHLGATLTNFFAECFAMAY